MAFEGRVMDDAVLADGMNRARRDGGRKTPGQSINKAETTGHTCWVWKRRVGLLDYQKQKQTQYL